MMENVDKRLGDTLAIWVKSEVERWSPKAIYVSDYASFELFRKDQRARLPR